MDSKRRILFVCTANICRSPAAEVIARSRFGESHFLFRSAGFLTSGEGCPDHMITSLGERGMDASNHLSYMVDADSLFAADLVLTMEGAHVQKATVLAPETFEKIFPIKEAAEILGSNRGAQIPLEDFVAGANEGRDPLHYLDRRWDVSDPYGGKIKGYRQAVVEIESLVSTVVGGVA